jgi:hypothetical protein
VTPAVASSLSLPLHLGELHAYEHLLVWLIAFGPFLVLGAVVVYIRRRDMAAEDERVGSSGQDEPASQA